MPVGELLQAITSYAQTYPEAEFTAVWDPVDLGITIWARSCNHGHEWMMPDSVYSGQDPRKMLDLIVTTVQNAKGATIPRTLWERLDVG